jgi:O-antigen/teichoic acid export membrane protein
VTGPQRRAAAPGEAAVAVATVLMNVASYGYTIVAARIIGPSQYGAFVASLSLLIVVQVVSLGLQATAARRIAVGADHVASIERSIMRLALRLSLVVGVVLGLGTPVIDALLNLDSPLTAAMVALAAVPLTLAGGQAGILQGERRWGALSLFYLAGGIPRLLIGTAVILWRPDATNAVLSVAIGYCFPLVVGWWALRGRRTTEGAALEVSAGAMLVESVHNAQVLFAYFSLSSADIVIARRVLSDHDAGLYAAGLIMTKVMFFLPQFVTVIAFPDMATPEKRHRAVLVGLLAVGFLGGLMVVAAKVLSGLAMVFVGGAEFAEVEGQLWVFAVLGTMLAMLQLLVYAVLARQGRWSMLLVWGALVALVAIGLQTDSLSGLVSVAVGVDTLLLFVLTATSLRIARRPGRVDSSPP